MKAKAAIPACSELSTQMRLLALAAAFEVVVGLILMASPSLAARFLFGAELAPAGAAVGRVAGFALLALGVACWPQRVSSNRRVIAGLLAYNVLAAVFFLYLGIRGELVGLLLWPAAAAHGILSALLARFLVV